MSISRRVYPSPTVARSRDPWAGAGIEPGIEEMLADPVVQLVMRRDSVTPSQLRTVIAAAQARLRSPSCCRCAA